MRKLGLSDRFPLGGLADLSETKTTELASLLVASRQGDDHAYKAFLDGTSVIVRKFLRARLRSDFVIDDILQETLISIHKGRHSYLEGRPVEPWILAICRNRMIDYFRKAKRISLNETLTAEFEDLPEDSPEWLPNASERREKLQSAMNLLPEKQRKLVEYLKIEDLSIKEVAEITGMTEGSIKVAAHRAYAKLRELVGGARI